MFKYAYAWPTEWFLAMALLMCLLSGYSLFIVRDLQCGEGREEKKVDMDSAQRHLSPKWIFGVGKRDPHLLIHRYIFLMVLLL